MLRAALFLIAAKWKEAKCPQLMHGYMAFPYLGILLSISHKKNEAPTHSAAQLNPENTILDERNQSQRSHTA